MTKPSALLTTLCLAAVSLAAIGATTLSTRHTMLPESRLWITGTSTVHDWTCQVSRFNGFVNADTDAGMLDAITGTELNVAVAAIDCKNATMNEKVGQTLNAGQNPNIRFALGSANVTRTPAGFTVRANGRLTMAGNTRTINIEAQAKPAGAGRFNLQGKVPLKLTDFGMRPPTAMFGTLKTGDEIALNFDITIASDALSGR
jgi:polyisoprenoid-binding protein YceI